MPLVQTKKGWKFGERGHEYTGKNARVLAAKQGKAIKASQGGRMTNAKKAHLAMSTAHILHGSKSELNSISNKADKMIALAKPCKDCPKTIQFGGAAGRMKVINRFTFPPMTMGTSREAQRRGLPKRIHPKLAANIVSGRPRVTGYMYEPPGFMKPKVEVFLTLKDFKRGLKPVLVHELAHLNDYAKKGTAHNLESEKKAYSYQYASQLMRKRPSIDPSFNSSWSNHALKNKDEDAKLILLLEDAQHSSGLNTLKAPQPCVYCGKPTIRVGLGRNPCHVSCEARDVDW